MGRKRTSPVNVLFGWIRRQSMKVKIFLGTLAALGSLVALKYLVRDHGSFFVASEAIHALGILVLIYKLSTKRTCSGLSLRSQEVTAIFLAVRLFCSVIHEADIHTVLDLLTLLATAWVIYMIRFKLKSTYIKQLDNFQILYLVVPSALLAILIHPHSRLGSLGGMVWAFAVYLESVSVWPQLNMMQKAQMIEPFTAHYVFALGVARFLACAHWIIQVYETNGAHFKLIGYGLFWFPMAIVAEAVQTFILADFCYYYIKSFMEGHLITKLPV
ncbi:hypothetical protein SLEP1_g594 [Rubroshorea leprosula]|uniref:ER lumen protein retaining receptor n=1 Tax=Rubroshorea leprosula TaxID=152421 RepID=A0AAV5HLW9_9ROSI|nr:hypothetical protein SLEP1_g594 [Rubroshorea leprosula]